MIDLTSLKKILSVSFDNEEVIKQAFIHRSCINESKEKLNSNERLEFLGDCILSFVVSSYLFEKYPDYSEGDLTNIRSKLVKTSTLAHIANKLCLGDYLLLSRGEEDGQGRKNPSILADTFEALIGAVFVDKGLAAAKKIVSDFLIDAILLEIVNEKSYKDAKSTFQEMVQETDKTSPQYKVISEKGPDHAKSFTIGVYTQNKLWGKGTGKNKHEAEQSAALEAIENWKKK